MIGATTRSGLLTRPLRDRFGIQHRLEHYGVEDLSAIVSRSAGLLEMQIEQDGSLAIASRSRGTPRIANRLLRRVRDHAQVEGAITVTGEVAEGALAALCRRRQ